MTFVNTAVALFNSNLANSNMLVKNFFKTIYIIFLAPSSTGSAWVNLAPLLMKGQAEPGS